MYRLSRLLAVIAIALSPVWGVQSIHAASEHYPVYPSALYVGCEVASDGSVICGAGGTVLTQINSGYQCTTLTLSFSGVNIPGSSDIHVLITANSGTTNAPFDVNADGDFTVSMPFGFLVNNLAVIQITTPTGASFRLTNINITPCPTPNTPTPVPPTNTPNPSDTSTTVPDTSTPGPSGTPTPIATFTPIPVGHNTFTRTPTAIAATGTATRTPSVSPTPTATYTGGRTPVPCGAGFINCNYEQWVPWPGAFAGSGAGTPWVQGSNICTMVGWGSGSCAANFASYNGVGGVCGSTNCALLNAASTINFITTASHGTYCANFSLVGTTSSQSHIGFVTGDATTQVLDHAPYTKSGSGSWSDNICSNDEPAGTHLGLAYASDNSDITVFGVTVAFTPDGPTSTDTPTSAVPTDTPTATLAPSTATAAAIATQTAIALSFTPTPISIPGAQETAIPTDTECPGGCLVTALTAVPGLATRVTVDTSPFDPLKALSLTRSSCQPFGFAQIPYPVIHGTPAVGSTTPLSVTWTVADTSTWNDSTPYSNTAIQPCAMVKEIPPVTWDITYWLSVLILAIGWFLWLLGFVGRFSGDHSIDG